MSIIKTDLKFGNNNEDKVLEFLNTNNLDKFTKTSNWCFYDFKNSKYICELKSRRNTFNKYPTTMVGNSKFIKAVKQNKIFRIYFLFTDGLYYYDYNKEDKLEIKRGGRKDRSKYEYSEYCYIPISYLVSATEELSSLSTSQTQ